MDFTELFRQSTSLVAFSPGTHFLLAAVQDRLIVRRSETFQIARTWLPDATPAPVQTVLSGPSTRARPASGASSDSWITHIGWSCDSEYILATCAKRGVVHVFKLQDEDWSARIDAGAEGATGSLSPVLGFLILI